MALAFTAIAGQYLGADSTSYATTSGTPTTDALQLLAVHWSTATLIPVSPSVSGVGLTWTEVGGISYRTNLAVNYRTALFAAQGAPSGSGALTISFGAEVVTSLSYSWVEVTGCDTSDPIVQHVTNQGGTTLMELALNAAFVDATNNGAYAAFGHRVNTSATPEAGFTEYHDVTGSTPIGGLTVVARTGEDLSPSSTAATATEWGGIAIEIAVPGASSAPVRRRMALLGVG